MGVWALNLHGLSHRLCLSGKRRAARGIWKLARRVTTINIHPSASLGKGFKLPHPNGIVIAEYTKIGDNVTILQRVTIGVTRPEIRFTESCCPRVGNNAVFRRRMQGAGPYYNRRLSRRWGECGGIGGCSCRLHSCRCSCKSAFRFEVRE